MCQFCQSRSPLMCGQMERGTLAIPTARIPASNWSIHRQILLLNITSLGRAIGKFILYLGPCESRLSNRQILEVTGISLPVKCRATFHCGLAFRPDHRPCSSSPKFPAIHNILHKPFDIPSSPKSQGQTTSCTVGERPRWTTTAMKRHRWSRRLTSSEHPRGI